MIFKLGKSMARIIQATSSGLMIQPKMVGCRQEMHPDPA
jgi:hypothetical protein